jgi:hypothetical protein
MERLDLKKFFQEAFIKFSPIRVPLHAMISGLILARLTMLLKEKFWLKIKLN